MDPDDVAALHTARRAWSTLGGDGGLLFAGAELWLVELPMLTAVDTAVGTHRARPLVLVRLRCRRESDGTTVDGWGECAALGDTTYDLEDVDVAFTTLDEVLLPALRSSVATAGGALPSVSGTEALRPHALDRPLAFAALEMAVADAHLRATGRPFAELLGVTGTAVEPGAVLGIPGSPSEFTAALDGLAASGFARVKVKISPGTELPIVSALSDWSASVGRRAPAFQVDANGSYGPDDLDLLVRLDPFGLLCIEQPFDRRDLDSHRRLAARLATPVCLDESFVSVASVIECVSSGACSVVCVKPARLGGIGAALETIEWCVVSGVRWWIGGMFESGYARNVTTALGGLPGPALPGDLAPTATYLAADLVAPATTSRAGGTGRLTVRPADGPGMAPTPDPAALDRWRRRMVSVPAAG